MEDLFKVGIITSTHGVRGEVKVYPTTDDPKRFKKLKKCILKYGKNQMNLEIEQCKFFKQMVILKFKDIDNINDVIAFKQGELYVTRENAVKCEKDEYFISDLIDCEVINENGEKIGCLVDVMSTGANDVYVVKNDAGKEILIPAIKQCILNVDMKERKITVHLLGGMME